jgi:predicted acetyltransferase
VRRRDIVGMSHYLDLRLTVSGGAVVPVAGITWVAIAPTHRRRGILRSNDSGVVQRLDAAFISEVPAELGYGF